MLTSPEKKTYRTPVPPRTKMQRRDALDEANRIRSKRAELKRELKAGRESIFPLLVTPPPWLETMKLFDLMLSVPKFGQVKANKIMQICRISHAKTIGGLSERQRVEVLSMLRRR